MPFDPTYDVTHDRNPDLQPQSNVPLLSPPSPALGLSSLDPLVDHSARLQQTYERASDNAPYDAVANSFNSLMQSLGVDTSPAEAESSGSQDAYPPRPEGASSSGSGSNASGSATAGAAFGAPPSTQDMDYDPDAFWAQFPGETTADYGDFADQLESGRMNDPSAEQLSAFLDEVASQSDGRASPVEKIESPIGGAHDNRKRKSDVAGIAEPTGASSKEQSGTKAKRKR
ncbi:hypothetical protein PLICRDRAFT_618152 [Plicaturopsis crispa FD-325 SS-3]|nr:hypothetical protein PLICRDRAFT_618152 [Plicaturopsis crispa FD-325 SS-3]